MKKNKPIIGLKDMTVTELVAKAGELRSAITKTRLAIAAQKERNNRKVFNLRKERARALTLLSVKRAENKL